ncbi:MAG: hypothetical protein H6658_14850 [Ardenticatenaceae bacterium]|nr:hypothetical protein [Ardenticatenaceae bacterium]
MADVNTTLLTSLLKESLHKGQHPQLTIDSPSMTPLLRPGDEIILETVTLDQLKPGDILTLTTAAYLQTHRYWGLQQVAGVSYLLTRGDRPLRFDQPWPVEHLIGRVLARRRQGHTLYLNTGWGKWLNTKLARLAQIEAHWFNLTPTPTAPALTSFQRLQRRSLLLAAKLLAILVDFIG